MVPVLNVPEIVVAYCIAGIFRGGGLIFAFFAIARIHENYTHENFPRMRVHLCCTNNKPLHNTFFYSYTKIYHHEKYPLYGIYNVHIIYLYVYVHYMCSQLKVCVHNVVFSEATYMYMYSVRHACSSNSMT